jgi:putative transposase
MCSNNKVFKAFQFLLDALISHGSCDESSQGESINLLDIFGQKPLALLIKKHCPDFRKRVFDPLLTLFLFIGQALCPDNSLAEVVHQINTLRGLYGEKPISPSTSAYAQARKRLPLDLLKDIFIQLVSNILSNAPDYLCWRGKKVTVIDGTTFTMADTRPNNKEWEKHGNYNGKSNFPMLRVVGVFDLFTGVLKDFIVAPLKGKGTGEASLALTLSPHFSPEEVIMADSLYANYFVMADLQSKGVNFVLNSFGSRKTDFRQGIKLGKKDHLITIIKPTNCKGLPSETFNEIADSIVIRETEVTLYREGHRPKKIIVYSSFLDPNEVPSEELAWLYEQRWQAELSFRNLKSTLQVEHLSSKDPDMVQKQLYATFIAHNMVRNTMVKAAKKKSSLPCEISFKSALRVINKINTVENKCPDANIKKMYDQMLIHLGELLVNQRPGRMAPRKLKRVKNFRNYYKHKKRKKKAVNSRVAS